MNNKINKLLSTYPEELVEDLYINQNLTKKELCEKFNVGMSTISKLLAEYDLHKTSENVVANRRATSLKRYGVDNPSKSSEIKEKIKQSNLEKYGAYSYTSTSKGKAQVAHTKLLRYGDSCYNNIGKNKQTKLDRYGDSKYNNRSKCKQTMQDRYGVDNAFQLTQTRHNYNTYLLNKMSWSDLFKSLWNDREKSINYLKDKSCSYYDLANLLDVPYYTIQTWVTRLDLKSYINYDFTGSSHYESEIETFLNSIEAYPQVHNRIVLEGKELDFYIPQYSLGIEFNGNYFHSSLFKEKSYHIDKSKLALSKGIPIIHIWEHEWVDSTLRDKVKSIIKARCKYNERVVYARKCVIKEVDKKTADKFLNEYHLQNTCKGQSIRLGLYYEDELIQIMTFGKPRYNKNYEYELLRLCTKAGCRLVGGAERLFSYFKKTCSPKSVISYCDNSKFTGDVYYKLGFTLKSYGQPSKHWYNLKTGQHITDNLLRQRGYDQLFGTNYGKGTSNEQLMLEHDFVEIYDCGQSTFIMNL